jgi:hypothetical protein
VIAEPPIILVVRLEALVKAEPRLAARQSLLADLLQKRVARSRKPEALLVASLKLAGP